MSAHTPGPWGTTQATGGQTVSGPLGVSIAWCGANASFGYGETSYAISVDEARANAQLVAAAPDLLEALSIVRDLDDTWSEGVDTLLSIATRAKIDAAIAKATMKEGE